MDVSAAANRRWRWVWRSAAVRGRREKESEVDTRGPRAVKEETRCAGPQILDTSEEPMTQEIGRRCNAPVYS